MSPASASVDYPLRYAEVTGRKNNFYSLLLKFLARSTDDSYVALLWHSVYGRSTSTLLLYNARNNLSIVCVCWLPAPALPKLQGRRATSVLYCSILGTLDSDAALCWHSVYGRSTPTLLLLLTFLVVLTQVCPALQSHKWHYLLCALFSLASKWMIKYNTRKRLQVGLWLTKPLTILLSVPLLRWNVNAWMRNYKTPLHFKEYILWVL